MKRLAEREMGGNRSKKQSATLLEIGEASPFLPAFSLSGATRSTTPSSTLCAPQASPEGVAASLSWRGEQRDGIPSVALATRLRIAASPALCQLLRWVDPAEERERESCVCVCVCVYEREIE